MPYNWGDDNDPLGRGVDAFSRAVLIIVLLLAGLGAFGLMALGTL